MLQLQHLPSCDICRNHKDILKCMPCEHNENPPDIVDNFVPLPPADIEKITKDKRHKILNSLIGEIKELLLPNSFKQAFNLARKFNNPDCPSLVAVYVTPNSLLSTNSHYLCEAFCNEIPPELIGKYLLQLTPEAKGIALRKQLSDGFGERIINDPNNLWNSGDTFLDYCSFELLDPDVIKINQWSIGIYGILLNQQYFNIARDYQDQLINIRVYPYTKNPIVFTYKTFRLAILPMRPGWGYE